MESLSKESKLLIEQTLYENVMLLIEGGYNIEGVIDINNRSSKKIIFKDKKTAIQMVADEIERFCNDNQLDIKVVKDYLLNLMIEKIKSDDKFSAELNIEGEIVKDI